MVYTVSTLFCLFLHTVPRQNGLVSESRVKKLISYKCIFLTLNNQKMASSLAWLPRSTMQKQFSIKNILIFFFPEMQKVDR